MKFKEAESIADDNGFLKKDVINGSKEIIKGNKLKNKELVKELTKNESDIEDWGKYKTKSIDSPTGKFKVHFYKNSKQGKSIMKKIIRLYLITKGSGIRNESKMYWFI